MVKTLLSFALATMGALSLSAQEVEVLPVSSYEPLAGLQTELGAVLLNFSEKPTANPGCADEAVLKSESLEYKVASTSSSVQTDAWDLSDNQARITFSTKRIVESGDYTLTVPEGFFTFESGKVSSQLIVEYKIASSGAVIVSPESGYPAEIPTEVKITVVGAVKLIDNHVTPSSEGTGAIRWDTPSNTLQLNENMDEMTIEGNTITFKLYDTPPTEPGEYKLIIYAGAMSVEYEDGTTGRFGGVTATYQLPRIPRPAITPAEGKVYELDEIVLTLEDGATFGYFMRPPSLFKADDSESRVESWAIADPSHRGKSSIRLTPYNGKAISTPGKYRFKIGKASFSAVGMNYSVDNPNTVAEGWNGCDYYYDFTILPSPGEVTTGLGDPETVAELSMMNFYFEGAETLEVNPEATGAIELRDQFWRLVKGYEISYNIVAPATEDEVYTVAVEITPALVKDGDYTVYLPEGLFLCNGTAKSKQYIQNFTVDVASEVAGLEAPEEVDVYSIDGCLVVKNATASDIQNLPAGLYIAGGKKIYKAK